LKVARRNRVILAYSALLRETAAKRRRHLGKAVTVRQGMSYLKLLFVLVLTTSASPFSVIAEATNAPRIVNVFSLKNGIPTNRAALGDSVVVEIGGMRDIPKIATADKAKVALLLDQIPLKGVFMDGVIWSNNVARFRFNLTRSETCHNEWGQLFGNPNRLVLSNVAVTLQLGDDIRLNADPDPKTRLDIVVIREGRMYGWIVFVILYVGLVLWLAKAKGMLRDSGPKPAAGHKPYSLAMVQIAFWFSLVMPSFVFLWLMTGGRLDTLNKSALALIGIGTFTALAAKVQDDHKRQVEGARLAARKRDLEALPQRTADQQREVDQINTKFSEAAVSEGFVTDILTGGAGISFHRLQMVVWTLVLGVIFLGDVWSKLAMPEFDATLLGLMGISSGTYLGFMLTEPHSTDQSKTDRAAP
jgi:hypothetical protein